MDPTLKVFDSGKKIYTGIIDWFYVIVLIIVLFMFGPTIYHVLKTMLGVSDGLTKVGGDILNGVNHWMIIADCCTNDTCPKNECTEQQLKDMDDCEPPNPNDIICTCGECSTNNCMINKAPPNCSSFWGATGIFFGVGLLSYILIAAFKSAKFKGLSEAKEKLSKDISDKIKEMLDRADPEDIDELSEIKDEKQLEEKIDKIKQKTEIRDPTSETKPGNKNNPDSNQDGDGTGDGNENEDGDGGGTDGEGGGE